MRPGFSLALGVSMVIGAAVMAAKQNVDEAGAYRQIERFTRAMEQVRANYVDPSEVGYERLVDGAIAGMLQSLDPFSEYLSPENYALLEADAEGHFGGVGIVVNVATGDLEVVETIPDTPAEKSGIQAGDRITRIDGYLTREMSVDDAVNKMRGKPGTSVEIELASLNNRSGRSVKLQREVIQVPAVSEARILTNGIGYLRLEQFSVPAVTEVKRGMESLLKQGMTSLVLDLRNNPGGLLDSAVKLCQLYVDYDAKIVSTIGRTPGSEEVFRSSSHNPYNLPMCVLVNGDSASASEIVAGALQDHKRAVLIGQRTFGKASVQNILPFEDGSALRITTAHYYTPSNRRIHGKGIEPDIAVDMDPAILRLSAKESARLEQDTQLQRAIQELTSPAGGKAK